MATASASVTARLKTAVDAERQQNAGHDADQKSCGCCSHEELPGMVVLGGGLLPGLLHRLVLDVIDLLELPQNIVLDLTGIVQRQLLASAWLFCSTSSRI